MLIKHCFPATCLASNSRGEARLFITLFLDLKAVTILPLPTLSRNTLISLCSLLAKRVCYSTKKQSFVCIDDKELFELNFLEK